MIGFIAWLAAFYLFLIPATLVEEPPFSWWAWWTEFFFLILIYITGISFCLRKCRVDPRSNFLIDFTCLYAPISLTTLPVVWGIFHLLTSVPWALNRHDLLPEWLPWIPWLGSTRVYDVFRLLTYVLTVFVILLRVGEHMEKVAELRESANPLMQPTGRERPAAD